MAVIDEIAAERRRQIEQEGWSAEHDDEHDNGELSRAASCYAWVASAYIDHRHLDCIQDELLQVPAEWPPDWHPKWWKPTMARRDLIKAAALIVAEIERLDRAAARGLPNG